MPPECSHSTGQENAEWPGGRGWGGCAAARGRQENGVCPGGTAVGAEVKADGDDDGDDEANEAAEPPPRF